MGNKEIDECILASCTFQFRKVAMVVVTAAEKAGIADKPWGYDAVAKRLRSLAYSWKLRRSAISTTGAPAKCDFPIEIPRHPGLTRGPASLSA